jgi:hypothetical protein
MERTEAVLILLQHSFEMLLKGTIYQKRGTVYETDGVTYGFDRCLAITRDDLNLITKNMSMGLSILDGFRDCATHYHLKLSEDNLYLQTQAAVTMFDEILFKAFGDKLANQLPERVLPVSTNPPKELLLLLDTEFTKIALLLAPGKRLQPEVKAMIRPFLIMESAVQGNPKQPSMDEVSKAVENMRDGCDWRSILPGIAGLQLDTVGNGLSYSVKITREENAAPVRMLRDGDDTGEATLIREVNYFDRYSMGLEDLAKKIGLGNNKTLALIHHLGLQDDPICFKIIMRKTSKFKCYSPKALERINQALPTLDIEQVWQEYRIKKREAKAAMLAAAKSHESHAPENETNLPLTVSSDIQLKAESPG